MKIHIQNLEFKTIIGILEEERKTPQRVIVDAKITYDYKNDCFIDYAKVVEFLKDETIRMAYHLIEDALLDLGEKLKFFHPQIHSIKLKITKPDIIENAIVGLSYSKKFANN